MVDIDNLIGISNSGTYPNLLNSTDVEANPQAGDILFKGNSVERSGSLGWVYANYYSVIPESSILDLVTNGSSTVRINWTGSLTNPSTGIELAVGKTIRIQGFSNNLVNGKWVITITKY